MTRRKTISLIDFDNVLFENERYKAGAFLSALSSASKLPPPLVESLYQPFRDKMGYFDLAAFAVHLVKTKRELDGKIISAIDIREKVLKIDTSQYLDSQALQVIELALKLGPVAVFSKGDASIQLSKISQSGILEYLEDPFGKTPLYTPRTDKKGEIIDIGPMLNDRLWTGQNMIIVDPKKENHAIDIVTSLVVRGFRPRLIDDDARVLEKAYAVGEHLGIYPETVFVDQGPYAAKRKPQGLLAEKGYSYTRNLFDVANLLEQRILQERGLPSLNRA